MPTLLSSYYLAPIEYYRHLNRAENIIIEQYDNYTKQTFRNRCVIATANGLQTLSAPIVKPATQKSPMRDIRISDHGAWQHLHWNAIISAYNSSPFLDYYADDFRPFYEKKWTFLFDFNEALRETVCKLLDISPNISYSEHYVADATNFAIDLRDFFNPKKNNSDEAETLPYYQVFADRYGFRPNLSIVDLLFNMGPESVFWL